MGKLDDLKAELDAGHPDTGTYNVDDALAAAQINLANRTVNKGLMSPTEIFQAIDKVELNALSSIKLQHLYGVLGFGGGADGGINPFGLEKEVFVNVFGGGSATITALAALRTELVSRAQELGLGEIGPGLVEEARRLP